MSVILNQQSLIQLFKFSKLYRGLLLFIFCFYFTKSNAQQFNYTTFGVEDGLAQSTVFEIFQDNKGYLWLGTDGGGLCRYDGFRFKTYGKSNGLGGNVVRKIVQDEQNTIWIATNEGLYNIINDTIRGVDKIENNHSVIFMSLFIDHAQNIWASSSGKGVFKITKQDTGYSVKNYNTSNGMSGNYIFDICEDESGKIWMASFQNGLDLLNPATEKIENFALTENGLNEIISLKKLNSKQIAFGTRTAGAYLFNVSDLPKINYSLIPHTENSMVWSFSVGKSGECLISTENHGVVSLNGEFKLNKENGLPTDKTYKVFIDKEQNIWVGCGDAGVSKFTGNKFTHITKKDIPELPQVSAILKDKNNYYWMATANGIYEVEYKNEKINVLAQFDTKAGLPHNEVTGLSLAKDNSLWIATRNGIGNLKDKRFKNYSAPDLVDNNANCILADSRNRVWVGTAGGLSMISEDNKFTNISESNGLANNEVQCLLEDKSGNIWIGTLGGLIKFDGQNLYTFNNEDGLSEKKIYSLAEDKNGNIYVGTFGGGLYRYNIANKGNKKITELCNDKVLNSNNIYSLVFSHDYTLLAGTNFGINKINFSDDFKIKSIVQAGRLDGFIYPENSANATFVDGKIIWFGTNRGVTLYHSDADIKNEVKPKISISDLKINGLSASFSEDLHLSADKNSLRISFVSISLTNPLKNSYYYKLIGHDSAWSKIFIDKTDLNDFGYVEFKKLTAGNYELLLKSKNNDNVESDVVSLKFVIAPPFYKTKLFIFSSILVFILLVYFFFKFREKALIKEKEKLEEIVTVRTAEVVASKVEIEAQKDLLEAQKHEITDSINYSKRIQNAILPDQNDLFNKFKKSFILYQPKDIVSGDFYFFTELENNKFCLGVADCTGHGVPGAFMSMIGSKELAEAVKTNYEPKDILSALNIGIRKTLKQSNVELGIKDGMDIVLLVIDPNFEKGKLKLLYSAANRPLWILYKDAEQISEIKATKHAIGGYTQDDQVFMQEEIIISEGDSVYLFSDGYADQFGGDSGKKMMTKRFKELIIESRNLSMKEKEKYLSNYFKNWMGTTNEQVDDVLVIGLGA